MDYVVTQRWLNAAVGIGYALAFIVGAGSGFHSNRMPRQEMAPRAQASGPAEASPGRTPEAKALFASVR